MLWSYDGQIKRYVTQLMRLLSNFPVKDGKGNIKQVPVTYGNLSRQVGHILKDNSENKLPSAPRIAVYITDLQMDRDSFAAHSGHDLSADRTDRLSGVRYSQDSEAQGPLGRGGLAWRCLKSTI